VPLCRIVSTVTILPEEGARTIHSLCPPEHGLEMQRVHTDVAVDELLPSDAWRRDGTEDIRYAHPERKQCPVGARGSVEFDGDRQPR
jgi:hypothetical protein